MAAVSAVSAGPTLTSTVGESGFNGGTLASMPLTANGFTGENTPWDFSGQDFASLTGIDTISVSLILGSADSGAPGETNFDEFTLGLDGIDTGLKLNGTWEVITSPNQPDVRPPLTFTGVPLNIDQILASLQEDGQLVGTILDSEPGDDFITLGSSQGAFGTTTLVINGIAAGQDGDGTGNPGDGGTPGDGDGGIPGDGGTPGPAVPLPAAAWMGLSTMALGAVGSLRRRRLRS
jgi:hypothetical protein